MMIDIQFVNFMVITIVLIVLMLLIVLVVSLLIIVTYSSYHMCARACFSGAPRGSGCGAECAAAVGRVWSYKSYTIAII